MTGLILKQVPAQFKGLNASQRRTVAITLSHVKTGCGSGPRSERSRPDGRIRSTVIEGKLEMA